MANNQYRLFQSSRVLTKGILAALVLGLFVLTASSMADIVERYNAGGTLTGSGSDVAAVQNADGLAENDVIIISGTATHNTGIAQTIQNFTIRSSQAGVKQTIKAGNTRLYNFNDGVKTYNINLKDLDYQGYSSAVGNAIGLFMHTSPNLTLNINTDNVSFTGFKNAGYHGGVFGLDGAGNLNIVATNGLVFDGNRTNKTTGGAIHVNNGTLSIKADTLTFKNSYAATIGGAIYAGNKVTIEADSMTFESNSAGGGQGGAIYSKHDTLISGNTILFKSNSSTAHAGAIRLDNSSATLTIKGNSVTFDNNNGAGNEGGAICAHKLVMNGTSGSSVTTFKNNKTKNFGGAICAYTEATFKTGSFYFDNNSFSTRYTSNGYGGGAMTTNKLTISDVNVLSFTKNNSAYNGGAINLTANGSANIEAKTIIFEDNVTNDHGGAIHGGSAAVVNITGESISFARNSNKAGDGGAIRMADSTVNVSGKNSDTVITFSDNVSKGLGGAISARANLSNGQFTFENNSAGTYGGAIHGGIVAFSGDGTSAVFTGNTAVSGGNDLNVSVSLSFTDNGTYSFDGGIRLVNDDTTMTINKAQVTVAGRANDTTNDYQLKNTTITNGGKLTANLDNINSFTGAFNLGYSNATGTLELNLGAGLAKEISLSDVSFSGDGTLVKSGAGTVTFTGSNNTSFGNVKVSGGTLVVPSTSALGTYNVLVESGATFKTGTDMNSTEFVLEGGTFVVGDTSSTSIITISSLTLDGGRICFDFNDASDGSDADWLNVTSSVILKSGYIDLTFNDSSADEWWAVINDSDSGLSIIDGNIDDYERFKPENFKVTVNGMPTNSWTLEARSNELVLIAVEGEDPTVDPWYDANTSDVDLPNWTITGTDRVGAKFTEGGADAEYSGEVNMNGNGSFDVAENKNLTLSGVVSGSGSVTKTGAGTLTLSNAPGWTGNTTVNAGTLQLGADSTLNNLSGTNAEGVHGTVDYGATNLTLNNTADTEFAGVISGSGSVAKTGANTLTLSGANTYTGATTVSAGELVFSGSSLPVSAMTTTGGTLVLGSAGNTIVAPNGSSFKISSGNIRVDGNVEINSGTVTVKGDWTGNGDIKVNSGSQLRVTTNLSYDKGITLNGGTFRNATDGRTVTVNAPINVTANSYLQAGWSETVTLNGALKGSGNITIPDDSGWVIFAGNGSNYTGSLLVQGKMRVGASGTDVSDSKALIGSKEITFNGGTIQNNNNNLTITNDVKLNSESYFKAGWSKKLTLTGAITGSGKFHVLSDSGWVIAATTCTDNSFTGSVHTDNDSNPYGLLRLGADNPFGANAGEARIWGTLDMNGYSQTFEGVANSDSTSSGTVRGTSSSVLTLKLNNSASKVFGGKIENGLNLVLTGDGTGVQTLKQAPAYTGYTRIEAGTLILSSGGTLYNLSGNALGTVNNNGKAITLNNSSTTEFAGVIKGAGSLTKSGAGKLTLSGANAYTGATTVSGGTLVLASSGSLTSNVTVASGAAFIDGASSIASNVTINGGAFTIGDTSAASRITIGDFALTSGTVNFDFNSASTADNYDFLTTGAATLTAGSVNLLFNNGDEAAWWNNATDSGYVLISSTALTANLDNIALLINSSATENWYLATADNALVLKKTEGPEPPPVVDYYYRANSEQDLAQDSWTIDGTDKQGVKFTEGVQDAVTYSGDVNMDADGSVEVAENKNLTLSGVVSGEGAMDKTGEGTLTLSGDNTYSGDTTVSEGKLTLSGAAVKANGPIDIAANAMLEYNVPTGEKSLEFTNSNAVTGSNAIKTGAGTLKILSTDGQFAPDNFAVEAGELDFKGKYNGDLIVKTGSTLSPGNSVGDLTVYGNVTIDPGATGLFEFSPYDENNLQFDTLTVNDGAFVIDENSIIKLFFEGGSDVDLWAAEGETYKLVSAANYNGATPILDENFTDLFRLDGIAGDGLYLIGLYAPGPGPEPGSGVPEPSTWALLILGAAGLLYMRKRNK